jgi:hypothetical protein
MTPEAALAAALTDVESDVAAPLPRKSAAVRIKKKDLNA